MKDGQIHIISLDQLVYGVIDNVALNLKRLDTVTDEQSQTESCLDKQYFKELSALNRKINALTEQRKVAGVNDKILLDQNISILTTHRCQKLRLVLEEKTRLNTQQFVGKQPLLLQFYYDVEKIARTVVSDRMELNVNEAIRKPPSGIINYPSDNEKLYGIKFDVVFQKITDSLIFRDIIQKCHTIMGSDTWNVWGLHKIDGMYVLENYGDYRILEWYNDHWDNGNYVKNKKR